MTKLFNGWIDGSVEPRDGLEAIVVVKINGRGVKFICVYDAEKKIWRTAALTCFIKVIMYLPIPPHDKIATTGASVLEVQDAD